MSDWDADLAPREPGWRRRLYVVIFRHDTSAGRAFDLGLMVLIALSVAAVMAESMPTVRGRSGRLLLAAEWYFTLLFTVEYVLRLICVRRPLRYAFSGLGLIDLLAIAPTYLSVLVTGAQSLIVIRALRLLRIFRVLKLPHYTSEAGHLSRALRASRRKITVFVATVLTIVLVVGALMYLVEGPANGFTSIPLSCYWAIVTLTTVGYGDVAPQTAVGRLLASALMITGYGIIAVPTGIVTAELVALERRGPNRRICPGCGMDHHDADATHCKYCGETLPDAPPAVVVPDRLA